ncbi:MAG: hypothetical protein JW944_01620 [Deltaproteobacteria bacterium]|nr:hypothetical protein [Deltaproteobacteria bacterium]
MKISVILAHPDPESFNHAIARTAIVFNTSNTDPERERDVFGDPLETIWKNCIFGLCGVDNFHRRIFSIIVASTEAQRIKWLDDVKVAIDSAFSQ